MPERLKVLVKSPFSGYSGYGQDGFGILRALHNWGCDVYPQPTWLDVPVPRDLLPLFGKTLQAPFDLLINHWDPEHLKIDRAVRGCVRAAVAWTMWEFAPPAPGEKKPCIQHAREGLQHGLLSCRKCSVPVNSGLAGFKAGQGTLKERLRWYDMVLGYDDVSLAALAPYIPPRVSGQVLMGGFDSADWPLAQRDWDDENFGFFMHGQLGSRKCPWTTVEAFSKLKFEKGEAFAPARLSLHTITPGHIFPELNVPWEPLRMRVYCEAFDAPTLRKFYAAHHVLVAPSRGEGKHLPGLEFSATGGVAAITNFGGPTQWLGGDWGYPLDYTLAPTFDDKPWAAQDARVSVDHLAETMWHIYTHRQEARLKAGKAREHVIKTCDWSVVVENLFRRVRDTVTSNKVGPAIYDKAMRCRQPSTEDQLIAAVPRP
jgi:hypothetical protein